MTCFDVSAVGVLGNTEIYRRVVNACLRGDQDRRFAFPEPNLTGLQVGTINWTATIAYGNPDVDRRTDTTRVVCVPGGRDD